MGSPILGTADRRLIVLRHLLTASLSRLLASFVFALATALASASTAHPNAPSSGGLHPTYAPGVGFGSRKSFVSLLSQHMFTACSTYVAVSAVDRYMNI